MFYLAIIVSVWPKIGQNDDGSVMHESVSDNDLRMAALEDVKCACTCGRKDNGEAQVRVPRLHRSII